MRPLASDVFSLSRTNADSSLLGFWGRNPIDEDRNQSARTCHQRTEQGTLNEQRTDDRRDGAYGKRGEQRDDIFHYVFLIYVISIQAPLRVGVFLNS